MFTQIQNLIHHHIICKISAIYSRDGITEIFLVWGKKKSTFMTSDRAWPWWCTFYLILKRLSGPQNLHYKWRKHLSLLRNQVLILSCCHCCFCCEITVLCCSCWWNMLGFTYLRNWWIVYAVLLNFRSNLGFGPECFDSGQKEPQLTVIWRS